MKRIYIFLILAFVCSVCRVTAQENTLDFYLPAWGGYTYDQNIPTPKQVLGFEIGEQHATYEQVLAYMKELAQKSNRVIYSESGTSYERRPLAFLTISSPGNLANLETIRQNQLKLADPSVSGSLDVKKMPVVVYLTYSIHGNEASGVNASLAVSYFLAAAQGAGAKEILENTVVIIQPGQNPDGINKFASWVNSTRSFTEVDDNNSLEFKEPYYPSSRANHYWFDLNRDWLTAQHPESRGRMAFYYNWRPTVVGDFHEHGSTNGSYFSPGANTSIDQNIPKENYRWSEVFGKYHGDTLSSLGTLYFSKEGYDDFFTGKGAALPDLQGGVAMLFEQPSSRGHIQRRNGVLLRFCDQIRNQAYCSYSTIRAALDNREGLLNYHRESYRETIALAKNDPVKGYVFGGNGSLDREFLQILKTHRIKVYQLARDVKGGGKSFVKGEAYLVPLAQPEYRTVKTIFEKDKPYTDSTFYDISTWTLPLALNLRYAELGTEVALLTGNEIPCGETAGAPAAGGQQTPEWGVSQPGRYGYCFRLNDYYSYKLLYRLLAAGIEPRVATVPFDLELEGNLHHFDRGTIVVYNGLQQMPAMQVYDRVRKGGEGVPVKVYPLDSGTGPQKDLGSKSFRAVILPKIAILCGTGAAASETGELWYLLDQKFSIPATMLDISRFDAADLSRYNVLVVNGNYKFSKKGMEKLQAWVENKDNKLITMNNAYLLAATLGKMEIEQQKGVSGIEGVILSVAVRPSQPLFYGIPAGELPVFKNNKIVLAGSSTGVVANYSGNPLLSGCTQAGNLEKLKGSPVILTSGNVVYLSFAPFFRGYFFGSSRVFLNALFFD